MSAGVWGGSVALQADALDFLGDSATYIITLAALGMSLRWRAGAAMLKGLAMTGFGLWVAGTTVVYLLRGTVPDFTVMGSIGLLALATNVISAGLLYRRRDGDTNMRSVWLCSRNDAIANIAVIIAVSGVWAPGSGWLDILPSPPLSPDWRCRAAFRLSIRPGLNYASRRPEKNPVFFKVRF